LSFYILKSTLLAAALFENFKNSSKSFLQQSPEYSILSFLREEMAVNFVVPEVNLPLSSFFILLLHSCSSANLFTQYHSFYFLFLCLLLFLHPSNPLGIG